MLFLWHSKCFYFHWNWLRLHKATVHLHTFDMKSIFLLFQDLYFACALIMPNVKGSPSFTTPRTKMGCGNWIDTTEEKINQQKRQPDLLLFHWLLFATAYNVYITKMDSQDPSQSYRLAGKLIGFTILGRYVCIRTSFLCIGRWILLLCSYGWKHHPSDRSS
jgi:hypothetical protein